MIGEDYFSELPTPGVMRLGLVLENDGLFPENIIVYQLYIRKGMLIMLPTVVL